MLYNDTNDNMITYHEHYAKTPFQKLRGLMFKRKFDYALIFPFDSPGKKKLAIHMMFVFCPIDIVYLYRGRVVDFYINVKPFTPYLEPRVEADTLIELPGGTLDKVTVYRGDRISVRENR